MADEMLRIAGRGEDGLAKAIQTDNNGKIQTKTSEDIIVNGSNKKLEYIATTLEPGTNETIDIFKSIIVDSLVLDADDENLQFEMQFRNNRGFFEDRERTSINPGTISTLPRLRQFIYTHPFIYPVFYDQGQSRFIFKQYDKQRFPFGIRFLIQNPESFAIKVTLAVHYRVTEVE